MILLGMGISSRKRRHMPKMRGAWAAKADGGASHSVPCAEFHGTSQEVLRPPEPLGIAGSRAVAISFLRRDPHAQLPRAFQKAKVIPEIKSKVMGLDVSASALGNRRALCEFTHRKV